MKFSKISSLSSKSYSSYARLLSSCKNHNSLRQIHARLIISAIKPDSSTNAHLINSYTSLHNLSHARSVFDSVPSPGTIIWNFMIRAYTKCSHHKQALETYHYMLAKGIEPDKYTFTFVLKACTGALDIDEGVLVHKKIAENLLEGDLFIGTGLIDMYCKAGCLDSARKVFDKMSRRDIAAWNALISGYSQSEDPRDALRFFCNMQLEGIEPNSVSLLNLFPALCKLLDSGSCRCIHGYVLRREFHSVVYNGLIDLYLKRGYVELGGKIFHRLRGRDHVSWGIMMAGYAHNGCYAKVLEIFDQMKRQNLMMTKVPIVSSLQAATELRDLKRGKEIHNMAVNQGIFTDLSVATPIMTMYIKNGELRKAKELFGDLKGIDLVAWTALISSLAQSGYPEEALSLFRDMMSQNLKPNVVTLVSVLPASADLCNLRLGKSIHCHAVKTHSDSDVLTSTALVSLYARCGCFTSALIVFKYMPLKDIVTWNALITGYNQFGEPQCAINMFKSLKLSGTPPNSETLTGLIAAGSQRNELSQSTCIHGQAFQGGFLSDPHVKNALIDMYAKSGSLCFAELLFHESDFRKDEVSWNILIAGYLQNRHARKAISAFHQMRFNNFQPNLVTFINIIPAAAKLTSVKEGMAFHANTVHMGLLSTTMINNSLIDMYAKCGKLDCAKKIFTEMDRKSFVSWNTILAAYAMHGHVKNAVEIFFEMKESSVLVDSVSFLNVLSACRHGGMVQHGRLIFNSMKDDYHLDPGLEHYSCMVDLLSRAGLFDETLNIIKSMPMEPDAALWGALLAASKLHCSVTTGELAVDHLVKLEPGNAAHYVVLSSIYAESGRWDDAGKLRSEMKEAGLVKSSGCSWEEDKRLGSSNSLPARALT